MKIAVTGAAGFLGRHLLHALATHGHETIGVFRPGSQPPPPPLCHRHVFIDIQAAPGDSFALLGQPDIVIHLAWGGLPRYASLHHYEQELPAHYRFLKGLINAGLDNLLVAGTCFEYGMQSGPLHEGLEPRPANPYSYAKDSLRRQLEYLKAQQAFKLIWPRLFYLYGEGQAESALYSQLRRAVQRGEARFNMSGGEQLRDYLPVTEVVRYLLRLALTPADIGVVNICSGQPISVRRLVENWISQNNWAISINLGHYPYPDHEPMAFWGERTKLLSVLA